MLLPDRKKKKPKKDECERLRHDIAQYVKHNAELATENFELRLLVKTLIGQIYRGEE
jgi:hypothetical protein